MSTQAPQQQQSIQKLLDENAQLIRALVENMSIKGKGMECIQYQQSLHKNLVFLASLADPSLNVKAVLPPPGAGGSLQRSHPHGVPPSSGDTLASQSGGGVGISSHMTTAPMSTRQPQTIPSTAGPVSSEIQAVRQTAPGGHYASAAAGKAYGTNMWAGPGAADPYAMQRAQLGQMGGGGGPGYQMGMSPDQRLRMRQEQLMQAQQAQQVQQVRRMQHAAAAAGGPMYPGGVAHPAPPTGGGMVGGTGMPPGYPHNPHSIPPGTRP